MTKEFLKSTIISCTEIVKTPENVSFDGKYFIFNTIPYSTTVNYVIDKNIMIYSCIYYGDNIIFLYDFNNKKYYTHKKNEIEYINSTGQFPTTEEEYFQYSILYDLPFDFDDALKILDFFVRLKGFVCQN